MLPRMSAPVRPCPACADTDDGERLTLDEMMFGLGESFEYVVCPTCASLRIAAFPDDVADYYSTKYYSFDIDPEDVLGRPGVRQAVTAVGRSILMGRGVVGDAFDRLSDARVRALVSKYRSVTVAGLSKGLETRVLDVGTGAGVLPYLLVLAGLRDVVGTDPFAERDRTFDNGARLLKRDLADVEGQFDLVMLHHSLEHVPDPLDTLRQVRKLVAPDGRVLVRIPTVSSQAYDDYGRHWFQLDPPRHFTLFSRDGMSRIASEAGFDVLKVVDDSTAVQFWASAQNQLGIPFASAQSRLVDPKRSPFSNRQVRTWEREAGGLNARGRGDQAAWVLTPGADA